MWLGMYARMDRRDSAEGGKRGVVVLYQLAEGGGGQVGRVIDDDGTHDGRSG